MKKVILIPFILLCMMLLTIPASAMENEPDNFRGIPWGAEASKSNLKKWGLIHIGGPTYWRDEEVSIGGVKIPIPIPISYLFDDGLGFRSVNLIFSGLEIYELILNECIGNWGKPDDIERGTLENGGIVSTFWIGEKIIIELFYPEGELSAGSLRIYLISYLEKGLKEIEVSSKERDI